MKVVGIDTHKDEHVVCALDERGYAYFKGSFPATRKGYEEIAKEFGAPSPDIVFAIEGTSSYGTGISRYLTSLGQTVLEAVHPHRDKRGHGKDKNDAQDAERAARDVLESKYLPCAKSKDGFVEQIRLCNVAREQLVLTKTRTSAAIRSILVSAPDDVREHFEGMTAKALAKILSVTRSHENPLEDALFASLRSLAKIWLECDTRSKELEMRMHDLLEGNAPLMLEPKGFSTITVSKILIAVGDNANRMRSEAAFASLCGVAPIEASSGRIKRHRLSRAGNRQANSALYRIAIVRMRCDDRTKNYIDKCISRGKSKREAIRCLKRYIAREIYGIIKKCKE